MKTPQEYVELFTESLDWEELITMIQKEAWNEAVEKDAESAMIEEVMTNKGVPGVVLPTWSVRVDKQSILKNKI